MVNSEDLIQKDEYNDIPVAYCRKCMSLNIFTMDDNEDYCTECGSTDIDYVHIEEWLRLYEKRFKKHF